MHDAKLRTFRDESIDAQKAMQTIVLIASYLVDFDVTPVTHDRSSNLFASNKPV